LLYLLHLLRNEVNGVLIIEYFKYLTNPASDTAKTLCQLQEMIAMEARYKRSKKQWDPHLKNSQTLIQTAASKINPNSDIVILGSGLLLDIPIDYLAKRFSTIYLVDVVHLKKTKRLIRKYNNIMLIEHDVTGLAEKMLNSTVDEPVFEPQPSLPCLTDNTRLVVSANMLSQIHLAPVSYADKKFNWSEQKLEDLARKIMHSHVNFLNELPCQTCLISDNKRLYKDRNHVIVSAENILFDIQLPEPDKTWYWEIAPRGELNKHFSMSSLVYAYQNFSTN